MAIIIKVKEGRKGKPKETPMGPGVVKEYDTATGHWTKDVVPPPPPPPPKPIESEPKLITPKEYPAFQFTVAPEAMATVMRFMASFADEAWMLLSEDKGLKLLTVDPAHVAEGEAFIPPGLLKGKLPTGPVLVNCDALQRIAKNALHAKAKSMGIGIRLPKDGSKRAKLHVTYGLYIHDLTLSELGGGLPLVPRLNWYSHFMAPTPKLKSDFKALREMTDHLRVEMYESGAILRGESDEEKLEIGYTEGHVDKGKSGGNSLFPLDYMVNLLAGFPEGVVQVWVAVDYPCKIEMPVLTGDKKHALVLRALIAPRIESE